LQAGHKKWVIDMNIIDMARASGLTVILDGRIGREEYQSVCGSVSALQRFAETLRRCAGKQKDRAPDRSSAPSPFGRLRRRIHEHARTTVAMAAPAQRMSRINRWSLK